MHERIIAVIKRSGGFKKIFKKIVQLYRREGLLGFSRVFRRISGSGQDNYDEWIRRYDTITDASRASILQRVDQFSYGVRPNDAGGGLRDLVGIGGT